MEVFSFNGDSRGKGEEDLPRETLVFFPVRGLLENGVKNKGAVAPIPFRSLKRIFDHSKVSLHCKER